MDFLSRKKKEINSELDKIKNECFNENVNLNENKNNVNKDYTKRY